MKYWWIVEVVLEVNARLKHPEYKEGDRHDQLFPVESCGCDLFLAIGALYRGVVYIDESLWEYNNWLATLILKGFSDVEQEVKITAQT